MTKKLNLKNQYWMDRAACASKQARHIFDTANTSQHHTAQAKQICATCPVKNQCQKYARDYYKNRHPTYTMYETGLIWAGKDATEYIPGYEKLKQTLIDILTTHGGKIPHNTLRETIGPKYCLALQIRKNHPDIFGYKHEPDGTYWILKPQP